MATRPARYQPDALLSGDNLAYLEWLQQQDAAAASLAHWLRQLPAPASPPAAAPAAADTERVAKQAKVLQLINAHRFRGHRRANLDPLSQHLRPDIAELYLEHYGFTEADLDTVFNCGSLFGPDQATLREILTIVRDTYCGTIGAEYMHIDDTRQKRWLQERLEGRRGRVQPEAEQRRRLLRRLVVANVLEGYLHTKYVGQKRFSLEGGEGLIPLLDAVLEEAGTRGTREVVIGMAHRGRLNVLVNILGKRPSELFSEFEDRAHAETGSGDVKYHLGYSADVEAAGGSIHLTLAFNPSHLEIVSPVVEGSVRARQDRRRDATRNQVIPVLIHGDAAFAGQGVVAETFNLSQTRGYSTGGTLHVVVNNQIGFTTSDPLDSRSTLYCTDIAKIVQAPIFHVNADDPEALVFVARLALAYRMEFNKDVVVDAVCYRKHGHSEADEPAVTQPQMYHHIKSHPGPCDLYADKLLEQQVIDQATLQRYSRECIEWLDNDNVLSMPHATDAHPEFRINFQPFHGNHWQTEADTTLSAETIARLSQRFTEVPEGMQLHPSVARIVGNRRRMGQGEVHADWGFAEALACASLLTRNCPVRISGQDCGRGTFFHRHAVWHDQNDGTTYLPLQHVDEQQAPFLVINSILSEEAVLAFEYGFSSAEPNALVIWEAQFGDFANVAQVVIDQFISSCEAKWRRLCGLTMLLPHGYDGQGPEHSSARLERYLQLCAEDNMQVCVPSTAAQMFHLLRRQILRPYRKPLIIMSPKSMLRQQLSASPLQEFTSGGFQVVIDECDKVEPKQVRRLLFCCGKVYYDLLRQRRAGAHHDVAIARIEQLYPFPREQVEQVLQRYPQARDVIWVQEEPRNQGAWRFLQGVEELRGCLRAQQRLDYAGRPRSASPAVGSMSLHLEQQRQLVATALEPGSAEAEPEPHTA